MGRITESATEKALAEANLTASRVRRVSNDVLSGAVKAAEESGTHIKEVTMAAAEGVRDGLTRTVNSTKEHLTEASRQVEDFVAEDIEQTRQDLVAIEELFVEILQNVARRSGEVAGTVLYEVADDVRRAGSSLRERAAEAAEAAARLLTQCGRDAIDVTTDVRRATHTVAHEAKELSSRALAVAKGAAAGMWKGAKEAFRQEKQEGEESR